MRWDAARAANNRPLPKPRKMHGPVGEKCNYTEPIGNACRQCGHHVCSCPSANYGIYEHLQEHLDLFKKDQPLWQVKRIGSTDICKHGIILNNGSGCSHCLNNKIFFLETLSYGTEIGLPPDPETRQKTIRFLTTGKWE